MGGFVRGLLYPLRGLGTILSDLRLLALSAAPVFLSLLLYVGLVWVLWTRSHRWFELVWSPPHGHGFGPALLGALHWVVYLLFVVVVLVVAVLSFVSVIKIAGVAFFDRMSLRTEVLLDPGFRDPGLGPSLLGEVAIELKKLVAGLFWWSVCLLSNLVVPGVGAVLGILLTLKYLPLEFLEYPMQRRGLSDEASRDFLRRNRSTVLGFGLGAFLALLVPLLAIVAVPACVVGGTLLYVEAVRRGRR